MMWCTEKGYWCPLKSIPQPPPRCRCHRRAAASAVLSPSRRRHHRRCCRSRCLHFHRHHCRCHRRAVATFSLLLIVVCAPASAGSAAAVDAALLPSCQAGRHRHAAHSRHRRRHRTATAVAALPSPCCRRRCRPATPLPAAAVLPPPRPPCYFRLVARHAAAKLPPPPPRTPRENRMTPIDPQKGGKTSSLAAAKRGRGMCCGRSGQSGQSGDGARSPDQKCSTLTQKCSTPTQRSDKTSTWRVLSARK